MTRPYRSGHSLRPTIIVLAALCTLSLPCMDLIAGDWQLAEAVVAMVNGKPIYKEQLEELAGLKAARFVGQNTDHELTQEEKEKIAKEALRDLVRHRLIEQEARKAGVYVSENDLLEHMKERNIKETELNKRLTRIDLLFEEILRKERTPLTEPSPRKVRNFYTRNKEKTFSSPRLVRARHITVAKATPDTRDSEKRRIKRLHEKLTKEGADFIELAKDYGATRMDRKTGGLIMFPYGEEANFFFPPARKAFQEGFGYPPEMIRTLIDLPAKKVSPVLETDSGFHILYIETERPRKAYTFEQAQVYIFRHIMSVKRNIRQRAWLVRIIEDSHITWHNGENIPAKEVMPPMPTFDPQTMEE